MYPKAVHSNSTVIIVTDIITVPLTKGAGLWGKTEEHAACESSPGSLQILPDDVSLGIGKMMRIKEVTVTQSPSLEYFRQ